MRKRPAPVSSISKTRRVCLHNRNNAGRFVFVSWQTRRAVSAALLHSLALCPNTSKTRPKTRQKRPKTGANVVLFRRNLLNFCILLIRPKRGQTKRRARRLLSGGWSTLHTGRAKHAPRFYHTAGGVEALPAFSCPRFAPFVPMIRPSCPRFGVFVPMRKAGGASSPYGGANTDTSPPPPLSAVVVVCLLSLFRAGCCSFRSIICAGRAAAIDGRGLLVSAHGKASTRRPPLVLCLLTAFHYLCR